MTFIHFGEKQRTECNLVWKCLLESAAGHTPDSRHGERVQRAKPSGLIALPIARVSLYSQGFQRCRSFRVIISPKGQTMCPCFYKAIPTGRTTVPLGHKTSPYFRKTIPGFHRTIPRGRRLCPSFRKPCPMGHRIIPLGRKAKKRGIYPKMQWREM